VKRETAKVTSIAGRKGLSMDNAPREAGALAPSLHADVRKESA
jgi:hypothetical protein